MEINQRLRNFLELHEVASFLAVDITVVQLMVLVPPRLPTRKVNGRVVVSKYAFVDWLGGAAARSTEIIMDSLEDEISEGKH